MTKTAKTGWKRVVDDFTGETMGYTQGPWTITKEFFADGPTLFYWIVEHESDPWLRESFRTKRRAIQFIQEHEADD